MRLRLALTVAGDCDRLRLRRLARPGPARDQRLPRLHLRLHGLRREGGALPRRAEQRRRFAPMTVTAPEGSILNSTPPGGRRGARADRAFPARDGALGARARRCPTAWSPASARRSGASTSPACARTGRPSPTRSSSTAATAPAPARDGANVLSWPSNVSSAPVEMIEQSPRSRCATGACATGTRRRRRAPRRQRAGVPAREPRADARSRSPSWPSARGRKPRPGHRRRRAGRAGRGADRRRGGRSQTPARRPARRHGGAAHARRRRLRPRRRRATRALVARPTWAGRLRWHDARYALGIDIGGTFTDIVLHDHATGRFAAHKELTTPEDAARGVVSRHPPACSTREGGRAPRGRPRGARHHAVHQRADRAQRRRHRPHHHRGLPRHARDGARAQVRALRPLHRAARAAGPPRAAARSARSACAPDGSVEMPLDEAGVLDARRTRWSRQGVEVARHRASCTPTPIRRTSARAARADRARFPQLHRLALLDVSPQIREYERTSTTVANAYIKPLAERYLDRLGAETRRARHRGAAVHDAVQRRAHACRRRRSASRSSCWNPDRPRARSRPRSSAGAPGSRDLLAFDMGGTTAKLARGRGRRAADRLPASRRRASAASPRAAGLPISISTIELIEIGAGGGSIAAHRRAGPAEGRAAQRRRRARARLLRPRRHGADRDRRQPRCSATSMPATFAGGTMRARPRAPPRPRSAARRRKLAMAARRRGASTAVVNENMAAAARVHVAEQRPRRARVRAARDRRRRPAARLRRRAAARHPARDLPAGGRASPPRSAC